MILIVGCGFLGSYLLKYALSQTDEKILVTVRDIKKAPSFDGAEYVQCDVTDKADLNMLSKRCEGEPLTIFYFAACHNVDYVYKNPDSAQKVNIDALESFLKVMPNIKKLFFASTDCVYGEGDKNTKFTEDSPLNPINEYGRQKLEAEKIVLSKGFTVLRFPFMLGPSLTSEPHFYDNICSKLLKGETVEMIDGMKRSVLSYAQTAELIYSLSMLPASLPPVINICSDTELSKYDIGKALAEKINASADLVKSISEEEGKKFFKDRRASDASMDNTLLKSLLGLAELQWEE